MNMAYVLLVATVLATGLGPLVIAVAEHKRKPSWIVAFAVGWFLLAALMIWLEKTGVLS